MEPNEVTGYILAAAIALVGVAAFILVCALIIIWGASKIERFLER